MPTIRCARTPPPALLPTSTRGRDGSPLSLAEYWMPFTPNRDFKRDPKMVVRAEGMYYWNDRGDQIIDGAPGSSAWLPATAGARSPKR